MFDVGEDIGERCEELLRKELDGMNKEESKGEKEKGKMNTYEKHESMKNKAEHSEFNESDEEENEWQRRPEKRRKEENEDEKKIQKSKEEWRVKITVIIIECNLK